MSHIVQVPSTDDAHTVSITLPPLLTAIKEVTLNLCA